MSEQLFLILAFGVFTFGIWWLYFIEYRCYREDYARQRLFKIRDKLFEQAEQGILSFDSKAYGITRTTLNGMIQFMHELSFLRLLMSYLIYKNYKDKSYAREYGDDLEKALEELPREARKVIIETQIEMHVTVMVHVVRSSILLMLLVEPAILILQHKNKWTRIRKSLSIGKSRKKWNIVDAEAMKVGTILNDHNELKAA